MSHHLQTSTRPRTDISQDLESTRSVFLSKRVKEAGIYYLEHESLQFTTQSGRQWKVYGSPVSSNV
jgi:hypothetical protein